MLSEIFKKPKTTSSAVTSPQHETQAAASEEAASNRKPVILGKVQLLSLPGASGWQGQWEALVMRAEQEATALATAGVDGLIVENTHDVPFADTMDTAGAIAMARLVERIQRFTGLPVGISVLRNDPETALAVAVNTKAAFIHLPLLVGAMVTEEGIVNSRFHQLMQYKNRLRVELPPLLVELSLRHVGANPTQQMSRLEHLTALAKATPIQLSQLAFVVADNELMPEEVDMLRTASCREILVENRNPAQPLDAYFDRADGVILDAGLRKNSSVDDGLPPGIDLFQAEETINRLRKNVPLHEMDPDIFLQRN